MYNFIYDYINDYMGFFSRVEENGVSINKKSIEDIIISAGLGLISILDTIPSYNLTVQSKSQGSIQKKIIILLVMPVLINLINLK